MSSSKLAPCLQLKALRERAQLTGAACGKLLTKRDGSEGVQSTYFRYEDPKKMGHAKINYHVIEKLMPLFVGRGTPPITVEDMIAVSIASQALAVRNSRNGVDPLPMVVEPSIEQLTVKYRAERGVYMDDETLRSRTFGLSNMSADLDVEHEQFCILVSDNHADPVYRQGTMLKCVKASAFPPSQMKGKRVIMRRGRSGMGISEIVVGQHHGTVGNRVLVRGMDGKPIDGDIEGVVIGSYHKE